MDKEGNAHAESVIEAIPVPDLRKRARKSRESRGEAATLAAAQPQQRRVTYNERQMEKQFSPTAPPSAAEQFHTPCGPTPAKSHVPLTPVGTHSPLVRRTFSNASNINSRPHVWIKKMSTKGDRCGACVKKIKFGAHYYKCAECQAVAHIDCRHQVTGRV